MTQIKSRNGLLAERLGLDHFVVGLPILSDKFALLSPPTSGHVMAIRDRAKYEDLDWECPFCGFPVRLLLLDSTERDYQGNTLTMGVETHGRPIGLARRYKYAYLVCQCPRNSCRGRIFVKVQYVEEEGSGNLSEPKVMEAYPYPNSRPESFPDSIPLNIREDFAEASRCRFAGALKGCVVMCRRVIQDIAKNKNIAGDTNKAVIKNLLDSGQITKPMFDAAHEIRHYGGYGAHPQEDGLDDITREIADSLLDLTNQFLENIYVMTGRSAALAKRRQNAKQKSSGEDTGD